MKEYFNYGDIPISFMYMLSGVECLLLLVTLIFISKVVHDWVLHLAGLLLIVVGYIIMLYYVPQFTPGKKLSLKFTHKFDFEYPYFPGDSSMLVPFTLGFLIIGAGYPVTSVSNASLVSKSLSTDAQGLANSLSKGSKMTRLIIQVLARD